MPDFDGGHYFLTMLAPIRTDVLIDPKVGRSRSHRHRLEQKLSLMATGQQSAAAPDTVWDSPFSRNTRNHLARFVIIDDPAFNGRNSGDALIGVVRNINPLVPQPVDRLSTPFLLFATDIDAQGDSDGEASLRAYTDELWATMATDLREIFDHCVGFDAGDAAAFHGYVKRCQVETTMPFNDYWLDGLHPGPDKLPIGGAKAAGVVAAGALLLWIAAILLNGVLALFGADGGFAAKVAGVVAWGAVVIPALLLVLVLVLVMLYRSVMGSGAKPFPTAPGSDLPTVLKSLFLQQQFTRFATGTQGLDAAALHRRFGGFLAAVQPGEATPTQKPGEMASAPVEWDA